MKDNLKKVDKILQLIDELDEVDLDYVLKRMQERNVSFSQGFTGPDKT